MPSKYNKTKKKTEWVSEDGDFILDGFDDRLTIREPTTYSNR